LASVARLKVARSVISHAQCSKLREAGPATLPTLLLPCIAQKLLINPFLRNQQAPVQAAAWHGHATTMTTSS
jgi:hypothetical protein